MSLMQFLVCMNFLCCLSELFKSLQSQYYLTQLLYSKYEMTLLKSFLQMNEKSVVKVLKVADLNFGCATFCALPSFGAVTTFSSHTALPSNKVSVKCSDIDMRSAIYFLFDHNTKYCTIYLCPHTVVATV